LPLAFWKGQRVWSALASFPLPWMPFKAHNAPAGRRSSGRRLYGHLKAQIQNVLQDHRCTRISRQLRSQTFSGTVHGKPISRYHIFAGAVRYAPDCASNALIDRHPRIPCRLILTHVASARLSYGLHYGHCVAQRQSLALLASHPNHSSPEHQLGITPLPCLRPTSHFLLASHLCRILELYGPAGALSNTQYQRLTSMSPVIRVVDVQERLFGTAPG
jgi:hypothetical protein